MAAAAAGVLGIRVLWGRRRRKHGTLLAGCWGLVALSAGLWIVRDGVEFGIVFALAAIAVCGVAATAAGIRFSAGRRVSRPRESPALPSPAQIAKQAARLFSVIAGGAGAGILGTLGLSVVILSADQDRLAFALVGFPLVWGAAAYALCHSRRPVLPSAVLVASAAAGAGVMLVF